MSPSHVPVCDVYCPYLVECLLVGGGVETEVVEDLGLEATERLQQGDHQHWDVGLEEHARRLTDLHNGRQTEAQSGLE